MRVSTNLVALMGAITLACASGTDDESATFFGEGDDEGIASLGPSGSTDAETGGETTDGPGDESTDIDGESTDTAATTSTGSEDSSEDSGMSTGSEPIPCDIAEAVLTPVVPHVVLVLDKSGSMIQNTWDHDADPMTAEVTRWKSLHAVVSQIVDGFDGLFQFGVQLYPSKSATNEYDVAACPVDTPPEVAIAPDNGIPILLAIPTANSNNVRGGTPASSGMSSAIDHLVDTDDGNPMAIILVTDGAANCRTDATNDFERFEDYDSNLATIVGDAWTDLGIATYVVGIDISDEMTQITGVDNHPPDGEPDGISPFDELGEVAVVGGKPLGGMADFYQTQNELELDAALQAIVDDAISCTVLLDPIPIFPDLVEVVIDDQNVPHVADCTNEEGWVYGNPNGPYDSIELCGNWCEASQDAMVVKAEYFCDPG